MKVFASVILLLQEVILCTSSSNSWQRSHVELYKDEKRSGGVGMISTCIDLCVADDYVVRSNVVHYKNINVNITILQTQEEEEEDSMNTFPAMLSTKEVYNLQSVSTQYLHASFLQHSSDDETSNEFKILNGIVLVKDQVHVLLNNHTASRNEKGVMLLSTIHVSYLLPTSITRPASGEDESSNSNALEAELSAILSNYFLREEGVVREAYRDSLLENGIISNSTDILTQFEGSYASAHSYEYEIVYPSPPSYTMAQEQPGSNSQSASSASAYVILISVLSTVIMILSVTLLQVFGIFDKTHAGLCSSKRYSTHEDEDREEEEDSSIESKNMSDFEHFGGGITSENNEKTTCQPYSEDIPNDFKITPLRGIYRDTDRHDLSILEQSGIMSDHSINTMNITANTNTHHGMEGMNMVQTPLSMNPLGITSMLNMPTTGRKQNIKRDNITKSALFNPTQISYSPTIPSQSNTAPPISRSYSSGTDATDDFIPSISISYSSDTEGTDLFKDISFVKDEIHRTEANKENIHFGSSTMA